MIGVESMRGVGLMVASVFRSEDLEFFLDLFLFSGCLWWFFFLVYYCDFYRHFVSFLCGF